MAEADLREIKRYLTKHLLQQWEQQILEKAEQRYATVQPTGDEISNANMALFIEQMNKRFEDVIRLIVEQRENNDRRFEDMNKRFEDVIGLIVEQRENNDRRFEDVNKRFEDMNKRFEDVIRLIVEQRERQ